MRPQRQLIAIEDVMVRDLPVTIVRFLVDRILETSEIEYLGRLLYALPDEHERTHVIVNLGNLQMIRTYMLGTLIGMQKRINKAKGRLVLCQLGPDVNPVVDEAFDVCGLKKAFTIYLDEHEALQSF